jgi:large subunit ribosomal protein L18e
MMELVKELRKHSASEGSKIWHTVASYLEKPTRKRSVVNIHKINRYTKENEVVIVPGKVLGDGEIDHKLTVAAFNFSSSAKDKILSSKGNVYSIYELMKNKPKGSRIKIIS